MNIAEKKTFNFFRILGITALACTIVLWAGLWISSGIPSHGSLNHAISDSIDGAYNLDSSIKGTSTTAYITISGLTNGFTDEQVQANITYYPSNAIDKGVEFSSSNETAATVDQNGVVTFHYRGATTITASLKSNPSIVVSQNIYSLGINPSTNDNNTLKLRDELKEHESTRLIINNGLTDTNCTASFKSSDESIATIDKMGIVKGITPGVATITAEFKDGYTLSTQIEVKENPNFVPATKITLVDDISLDLQKKYYTLPQFIASTEPEGASKYVHVISSDESIAYELAEQIVVQSYGYVTLTFYTDYDPSVTATTTVYISPIQPTELSVLAPNVVTPHTNSQLSASHMPNAYADEVSWEVIEGQGTITEKGVLTATFWGDIVVRCTSTIDPNIYTDVTIKCQIFDSAYYFVRKLMGHFGLSALLGFGMFFTLFLMDKRKWKAFTLTPVLSFGYAGISEIIQYFTPGRYCALTDIIIDFVSALIGMAVAMVILALITLVWRLASKKTFGAFTGTMKSLNIHNALSKAYIADEYTKEAPCNSQEQSIAV